MFELFSCFNTNFTKRAIFNKLCEKVIMATCCFYSFNVEFLHEIKHVQSLKVMSTLEHLPANVLNRDVMNKCRQNTSRRQSCVHALSEISDNAGIIFL